MLKKMQKSESLNKLKRISLVIYLRKFTWLFVLLLVFALTLVLGVWNVREIEFSEHGVTNSDRNSLYSSVQVYIGEVIFLIDNSNIEEKIVKENSFVKRAIIEKKAPSSLFITIEEHTPKYATYSLDKCILFSNQGDKIIKACEECEDTCAQEVAYWSPIYIVSSSSLETTGRLIFYEEVRQIVKVLSTFGYEIDYIEIDRGVGTFISIEEKLFTFEISNDLDIQLSRMFLVGQKINQENIEFKSLDLRFERPVMKLK
jgi:hypothetical protein